MYKSFVIFLILCVLVIFPNGLFNFFWSDFRLLKISIELGLYLLILINMFFRIPENKLMKYILINGIILFVAFELSNLFTYILIRNPKYFDVLWLSVLSGFVLVMTGTFILTLVGRRIKNIC